MSNPRTKQQRRGSPSNNNNNQKNEKLNPPSNNNNSKGKSVSPDQLKQLVKKEHDIWAEDVKKIYSDDVAQLEHKLNVLTSNLAKRQTSASNPKLNGKPLSMKNDTRVQYEKDFKHDIEAKAYDSFRPPPIETESACVAYQCMNPEKVIPKRFPMNAKACGILKDCSTPITHVDLIDGKCRVITSPSAGLDKLYITCPDDFSCDVNDDLYSNVSGVFLAQQSSQNYQGEVHATDAVTGARHYAAFDPNTGFVPFKFDALVPYDGTQNLSVKIAEKPDADEIVSFKIIYADNGATESFVVGVHATTNIALNNAVGGIKRQIKGFTFVRQYPNQQFASYVEAILHINMWIDLANVKSLIIPGNISHYLGYDLPTIKLVKASGTAIKSRVTAYSTLITNDSSYLSNGGLAATKVVESPVSIPGDMTFEQWATSGDGLYNNTGQLRKGRYNYAVPSDKMLSWKSGGDESTPWYGTDWNQAYDLDYSVVSQGVVPTKLQVHIVQTGIIELVGSSMLLATGAVIDDPKMPSLLAAMRANYRCYENKTHWEEVTDTFAAVINTALGYGKRFIDSPIGQSVINTINKEGPKVIEGFGQAVSSKALKAMDFFS